MIPASLGLLLLGAYAYGSVRRGVEEPAPVQSIDLAPEETPMPSVSDLMFDRLQEIKRQRLEERLNDSQGQGGSSGDGPDDV
jgi:hypothetical protein